MRPCKVGTLLGYSQGPMNRFHRFAAMFVMSAYVLTGGTGKSWILCFGSDGHVTVEATGSLCCQSQGSISDRGDLEATAPFLDGGQMPGGCGGCTDIPILAAETARAEPFKLQAKDLAAVELSFPCVLSILLAYPTVAVAPTQGDPTLPSGRAISDLRTVVLRR